MQSTARDALAGGRPKKYDQPTTQLGVVLLQSVREHLEKQVRMRGGPPTLTDAIIAALTLAKDLEEALEPLKPLLVQSAATHDHVEYSDAKVATLVRLVKQGLEAEGRRLPTEMRSKLAVAEDEPHYPAKTKRK